MWLLYARNMSKFGMIVTLQLHSLVTYLPPSRARRLSACRFSCGVRDGNNVFLYDYYFFVSDHFNADDLLFDP